MAHRYKRSLLLIDKRQLTLLFYHRPSTFLFIFHDLPWFTIKRCNTLATCVMLICAFIVIFYVFYNLLSVYIKFIICIYFVSLDFEWLYWASNFKHSGLGDWISCCALFKLISCLKNLHFLGFVIFLFSKNESFLLRFIDFFVTLLLL